MVDTKRVITFKVLFLIAFLFLFLPSINATEVEMGVYQKNSSVELIQLCGDCSYSNITSIIYPNTTKVILDASMTKRGSEFNYTYQFPDLNGDYLINGLGDLGGSPTVWAYTITLTPNGDTPTTSKILMQFGFIFILAIFLLFSIIGIFRIENYIARFVLYWVSHLLVVAMSFMAWNGSVNLLTSAPFVSGFFKILFYFSMISVFPMVILSMTWIFYIHLMNDDIKRMMDKGMDEDEAYSRAKVRRKR